MDTFESNNDTNNAVPVPVPMPYPKTSKPPTLRRQIIKARNTKSGKTVVDNLFCQILASEMHAFVSKSSLREQISTTDKAPDWNEILVELNTSAPTVLRAINAIAGVSDTSTLLPPIGTALCILANQQSKHCNKLQKFIGLVLKQSHTNQKV